MLIGSFGPQPTQKVDRMAFTFRLELEDETPADPPVLHTVGRCPYCSLRRRPECRRLRGRTYPAPRRRGRCPECAREYERRRGSAHSRGYVKEHKRLAAQVIAAHPFCVDCGATTDLCADHVLPISRGRTNTLDNYQVRCRSCNTARRDVDRRRPAAIKSHLR
jgi:5-methylcytosine-specific restriction endonuclease McrA